MSDGLDLLVFPELSVITDYEDAIKEEMKISKKYVTIKNVNGLIREVIHQTVKNKKLIRTLTLSSHGDNGYFRVGSEIVSLEPGETYANLQKFRILAPFFAKNAVVIISACNTATDLALLRTLSQLLGGVKVRGFPEGVYVNTVLNTVEPEGDHVICLPTSCEVKDPHAVFWEIWKNGPRQTGYR